ncbi:MAG: serine/threonine protein kinase [Deltaproteobacteria bacterium]|nr:serine/threonine protein kinase [Deltaproteobacteria bacterium]
MNGGSRKHSDFSIDLIGKQVLGRYHIVRKIAAGGMGVVYLARYTGAHDFAKPVVVKIILPGYAKEEQFLKMFIREAKILASLHHPGIVEVIDFGEQDDFYVMVLEYVHGFELREWAVYREHIGKVFSIDVILQIVIEVLEALDHAHTLVTADGVARPVIHRDISPSNVMLTSQGRLKLVDFGIARMNNMTGGYRTETGSFRGKLSYSSPERFGKVELTPECDIYSVGVMLHELLTGENEFYTGDHASTIARVLNHTVSSVLHKRPDAPSRLDQVIAKALAKNPADRYGSAMDFANDLRQMLVQSESAVKEKIASLIREDFNDDMAAYLGCESLNALESAWRNPSTSPIADWSSDALDSTVNLKRQLEGKVERAPVITDVYRNRYKSSLPAERDPSLVIALQQGMAEDTEVLNGHRTQKTEVIFRTRPAVVIGVLIFLIAAVALAVVYGFVFHDQPEKPDRFYLVQGNDAAPLKQPNDDKSAFSDEERPAADDRVMTDSSEKPIGGINNSTGAAENRTKNKTAVGYSTKDEAPLTEEEQLMMLSSVFQKEQRSVEACLANNETVLAGIERIFVRFAVEKDGTVSQSSIVPARLKGTPLARCIQNVAQKTRFPRMSKPLSFAIPIAVTRAGD